MAVLQDETGTVMLQAVRHLTLRNAWNVASVVQGLAKQLLFWVLAIFPWICGQDFACIIYGDLQLAAADL
jgi:hypothetical protein